MNPVTVIVAAGCVAAALAGQQDLLDNHRNRLPGGLGPAVCCRLADFDGDGRIDLVRATSDALALFVQGPGGRFDPAPVAFRPPTVPSGTPPIVALEVGRVVSARLLDVVIGFGNGAVQVYPNRGGALGPPIDLPPLSSINPAIEQILTGDLDANGQEDVIVLLNQDLPAVYSASAGFPRWTTIGPRVANPRGAAADFDGDGDADFVVFSASARAPAAPTMFQFQAPGVVVPISGAFPPTPTAAGGVVAADMTGNGRLEILLSPVGTGTNLQVFRDTSTRPGPVTYVPQQGLGPFRALAPRFIGAGDLDGDGFPDVIALDQDGALVFGQNAGRTPLTFTQAVRLLEPAPRRSFGAADIDGDGDTDLVVVGAGIEDAVLLGAPPAARLVMVDTEAMQMPVGARADHLLAVADVTGEGDPDLVTWDTAGAAAPMVLGNVDGQARFAPLPPGAAPPLPPGTYTGVVAASVTTPGDGDLLIGGWRTPANQTGVRVLTRGLQGRLVDESGLRWKVPHSVNALVAADLSGARPGSAGTAGLSDVVTLDDSGRLRIVYNRNGTFTTERSLSATPAPVTSSLHVADLDVDQTLDIVVVPPTGAIRLFIADATRPDVYAESTVPGFAGSAALVRDLSGDPFPDILLAQAQPNGAHRLVFLRGDGRGGFPDLSVAHLSAQGLEGPLESIAYIDAGGAGGHTVLLGSATGPDLAMSARAFRFGAPVAMPIHGSRSTRSLHVADLDLDGDLDVVVHRRDSYPALLLGQTTDFAHVGLGQVGRQAVMEVVKPAGAMGGLGVGLPVARVPLPGIGILRLANVPLFLPLAPAPRQTVRIPLPANLPTLPIPMQLFTVSGGVFRLHNLDVFRSTLH